MWRAARIPNTNFRGSPWWIRFEPFRCKHKHVFALPRFVNCARRALSVSDAPVAQEAHSRDLPNRILAQ